MDGKADRGPFAADPTARIIHALSAWYLFEAHTRTEDQVDRYLLQHGLATYPPWKAVSIRAGTIIHEAFFPTYLFVQVLHGSSRWPVVRWAPGSMQVIAFDGEPTVVPDSLINEVRDRLAAGSHTKAASFQKGEQVVVQLGPLAGVEAIFDEALNGGPGDGPGTPVRTPAPHSGSYRVVATHQSS